MSNILKKISARAKQIRAKHPSMKWTNAIKQASRELKGSKPAKRKPAKKRRVSSHQTGASNLKRDKQRSARKPGKRLSRSGVVYYERRKNRSDKPGSLSGVPVARLKGAIKVQLEERLGKAFVVKTKAHTKKAKKAAQKIITATRQQLNKLK